MEDYDLTPEEVLEHHGILGQKWGVRRYQNADGSLTPAGRSRAAVIKAKYNNLEDKNGKEAQKLRIKYTKTTGKQIGVPKKTSESTEEKSEQKKQENQNKPKQQETKTESESKPNYDLKNRPTSELSDRELQEAVNRIRNKREYDNYFATPERVSAGKKVISWAGDVALNVVTDVTKQAGKAYLKKLVSEKTGLELR